MTEQAMHDALKDLDSDIEAHLQAVLDISQALASNHVRPLLDLPEAAADLEHEATHAQHLIWKLSTVADSLHHRNETQADHMFDLEREVERLRSRVNELEEFAIQHGTDAQRQLLFAMGDVDEDDIHQDEIPSIVGDDPTVGPIYARRDPEDDKWVLEGSGERLTDEELAEWMRSRALEPVLSDA